MLVKDLAALELTLENIKDKVSQSSNWTVIKHNSGVKECFGVVSVSCPSSASPEGSMFYITAPVVNFPEGLFSASTQPTVLTHCVLSGGYACSYTAGSCTNEKMTGWFFFDLGSLPSGRTIYLHVHAIQK